VWGDPGFLERWTERESRSLNAGLVTKKKSLAELLSEPSPSCTTRDGEPWPIDRAVLERLAAGCGPTEPEALRLPIALHFSSQLDDACYVTDPVAATVLRRAESFGPAFPYRDGRMYLPLSLGIDLLSRYRGAIQQVFL
jgi:uncharacterized protein (UPF0216 family)